MKMAVPKLCLHFLLGIMTVALLIWGLSHWLHPEEAISFWSFGTAEGTIAGSFLVFLIIYALTTTSHEL